MATAAQTLITNAVAAGYDKLSRRDLLEALLYAVSIGGSGGAPTSINYVGPPTDNPPTLANIVVDSAGTQWMYWGGAWH